MDKLKEKDRKINELINKLKKEEQNLAQNHQDKN